MKAEEKAFRIPTNAASRLQAKAQQQNDLLGLCGKAEGTRKESADSIGESKGMEMHLLKRAAR